MNKLILSSVVIVTSILISSCGLKSPVAIDTEDSSSMSVADKDTSPSSKEYKDIKKYSDEANANRSKLVSKINSTKSSSSKSNMQEYLTKGDKDKTTAQNKYNEGKYKDSINYYKKASSNYKNGLNK